MKITHKVKNCNNEICGFVADDEYITYRNVLDNIHLFDNAELSGGNAMISIKSEPEVISKKQVNEHSYNLLVRQNSLTRDVEEKLEDWRNKAGGYVLYLVGARQTGKTTELLKFAYKNYEQIIYVNLARPDTLERFEKVVKSPDIRIGMVNYCREMKWEEFDNSRNTILIIDEIQESLTIYNSIREIQSGLKCDKAVTGSYLGKTINSRYFKPAGNVWMVEMLPLSFSEFCNAFGCKDILYSIDIHGKDSKENYDRMYGLYLDYVQIGGYPAVVSEYKKTKDVEKCIMILGQLIRTFADESASYFSEDKSRAVFENVYKEAFRMTAYEKKGTSSKGIEIITNFVKNATKEYVSRNEVSNAVSWLVYSHILGSCNLYNQGETSQLLPDRRFYFMDCGIAHCISRMTSVDNAAVRGILTENFAYTELYRLYQTNLVKEDKPCCSVYNNNELDFMIVDRNDVRYGIEIKSSDSKEPASLLVYLGHRKIDKAYIAGKTRGGIRKEIYSIPIYAVGCRFPYD